MDFGVVFPQIEFSSDPVAVRDYAQAAEELGFTHVVAYDHVLGANPDRPGGWSGAYDFEDPFLEVFVLFSYITAVAPRLGLLTGILILPQRQTALVAKQAATLDVLSGGRLRLGVGLGWNPVEYEALGEDFRTRGRRIEEQVDVLRRLWTEPLVTYRGRWQAISDAGINPLPVQRPIPIWFGGTAEPALKRAARIADGWLPNFRSPEAARPAVEQMRGFLQEQGRAPGDFGIEARLVYGDGDPEKWRADVQGWQELGAGRFSINTMGCGFTTPDAHIRALRAYAAAMLAS